MGRYVTTTGKLFASAMMLVYLLILAFGIGAIALAVCGPDCRGGRAEQLLKSGQEIMERYVPFKRDCATAPTMGDVVVAALSPSPALAYGQGMPGHRLNESLWESRVVKATAYNAHPSQTDDTPQICAWGDRVRPGIIAVSRDLEALGLSRGREVYVEGYGKMTVLDRMHRRKKNQIDIYMEHYGDAVNFGVQEVVIKWAPTQGEKGI